MKKCSRIRLPRRRRVMIPTALGYSRLIDQPLYKRGYKDAWTEAGVALTIVASFVAGGFMLRWILA